MVRNAPARITNTTQMQRLCAIIRVFLELRATPYTRVVPCHP